MEPKKFDIDTAYVTADGTWGSGDILLFKEDMLTQEQWNTLANLGDNDRYDYTKAVLEGDLELVAQITYANE